MADICERCRKPLNYTYYPGIEGSSQEESDGYFEDPPLGQPRRYFHHQCEDMKPLKRCLLPWVEVIERLRGEVAQ